MAGVAAAECQDGLCDRRSRLAVIALLGRVPLVAALLGNGSEGQDDFAGGSSAVVDEVYARLLE
eukprot:10149920-Heterocapsa_arctica.AAC.2